MSSSSNMHQQILQTLAAIPPGRVTSYGQLAKQAGLPGQARYVGYVLKHLPPDSQLPWHRVLNAQGKSSFPDASDQHRHQLSLLEREGIEVHKGKVSLRRYGWPDLGQ